MSKMLLLQQGKKTLSEKFREEQALTHLFPTSRFDYDAPRNIPISPVWYFNQRLLNFNHFMQITYIFQVCVRVGPLTFINPHMHKLGPWGATLYIFDG